jgi:diguanylate cyclase (GGDEF)-like protein
LLQPLSARINRLTAPPACAQATDGRLFQSFAILHLVGPLCGLPICAVLLAADARADWIALIFTLGVTLFWMFPLIARQTGRLGGPAFGSVQLLVFLCLFGSYQYGGLNSPFAVWLIVAVLLSFLYVPKALHWCLGAAAAQAALFAAISTWFPASPRIGGAALGALFIASSFAAALYISLIAAFYARIKTEGSTLAAMANRYQEAARELKETVSAAEAANEEANLFIAKMSHELRTPLNVVLGYSEMLIEDASAEEQVDREQTLRRVTESSRQMLVLIEEVARLANDEVPVGAALAEDYAVLLKPADGAMSSQPTQVRTDRGRQPVKTGTRIAPWCVAGLLCATLAYISSGARLLIGEADLGRLAAAGLLALATLAFLLSRLRGARPQAHAPSDRDDLTGLCNRAFFQAELDRRLLSHSGEAAALLFADLDGFKEVNDSLGHDVGDQLLNKVAERFALVTPPGILLARLGGDEFGAAAFGPGAEARIHDFAEAMVDALADPIATDEDHLTVGVSIGLAHGTAGSITSKELLRRSDVAMYRAKHDNRLQIQPFELQMDEALNFRRTMRQDLALALSGDQLDLHLQPVVNARTGELTGAEALLRWTHPVLGAVSPAKLIALAEESGQIISIDDWVLERALHYATRLRTIPIAVNISPVQFRHPGFARKIVDRLDAHSVPADMIRLEITEGVLVTHTRAAARAIGELREAGIKIALDDFGTGFSSLSYLKDFHFDLLKVDRSFVLELDKGRQGAELLRAIVDLGHSLGMSVIAEGVETANQAGLVQLLGCDYIQGYFTGRPMALEAFEARRNEPQTDFQVPRPLPLRARQR